MNSRVWHGSFHHPEVIEGERLATLWFHGTGAAGEKGCHKLVRKKSGHKLTVCHTIVGVRAVPDNTGASVEHTSYADGTNNGLGDLGFIEEISVEIPVRATPYVYKGLHTPQHPVGLPGTNGNYNVHDYT